MNDQKSSLVSAASLDGRSALALGAYALPGRVSDPRPGIAQAVEAERLGLNTLWLSERWGTKDFGVLAGAFGQATTRINIAAGVTHLQSRHPAMLASMAMTAQALTGGRIVLGVGRSVDAMWDAVGLPRATNRSIVDTADIFRRLCRGEKVRYDGPAGKYPSLRLNDVPDVPVPPLVFAALGPKGLALAGQHFDGVLLHPFLTPAAVRRSAAAVRSAAEEAGRDPAGVRIFATVVVASGLATAEEAAVVGGRAVTYYQIPGFGEQLARVNGWDADALSALRNHPQLSGLKGAADSVRTRAQLVDAASAMPPRWITEAAALGSSAECRETFERYRDAGADELVLHGSTPDQLGAVVGTECLASK
ncbi:TIGR03857 family LLM class F420-dependent oxidoreductase [Rhodococcus wratislaviensis]|uniref:TIGR03857 family LLM class F420-dependent oxidoreductase n=1 Tax=Rhodococcus wratislaviensis TaxID=44752 RepID=UPI00365F6927